MATTRISSGGVRVAALSGLFVAILAFVVIESILLAGPAESTAAQPGALEVTTEPTASPAGRSEADEPPEIAADAAKSPATVATNTGPPAPSIFDDLSLTDAEDPEPASQPPAELHPIIRPAPRWTPDQLQASLLRVPEISLQHPSDLAVAQTGRATRAFQPVLAVIDARPDLQGLPVRRGSNAQLSPTESDAFRDTSVLLRKGLGQLAGQDAGKNRRLAIRYEVLAARPEVVARLLHQMLQVEPVPLRKMLVTQLKSIRNPAASRALAHQAVYDPVAELRRAAVEALARRPVAEYLSPLLDAVVSPWPPAADHAADALAALAPGEAVPELVHRLGRPDPPDGDGVPTVRELVRINHAHNCLLCHAQSVSSRDGIRVAVPSPVRPLPSPFSLATYEGGGKGGSSAPRGTIFARPDTTYLRQDFSWMLPVANPGPWPELQRYDFVVRTRPALPGESAPSAAESPQLQAIVRALRALTGKDFGDRAADWRDGLVSAKKGG
jgi:hypothetical protein